MNISRSESRSAVPGPEDYFSGTVYVDMLFPAEEPSRFSGAAVTFEPGARTAWHTHPVGQILIVTGGSGLVQRDGGSIEEIHAGDIVRFFPNEKHWHGASPTSSMTHIAIQEQQNGSPVEWMEKVSDEQYQG